MIEARPIKKTKLIRLALLLMTWSLLIAIALPSISNKKYINTSKYEVQRSQIQSQLEIYYLRHGHFPITDAPLSDWQTKGKDSQFYFPKGVPTHDNYSRVWRVNSEGKVYGAPSTRSSNHSK
jgi:type II secretory pathway pseudopilin PulG